jgi:hypothetical protein
VGIAPVSIAGGTFEMLGGTISGNEAKGYGGGVYVAALPAPNPSNVFYRQAGAGTIYGEKVYQTRYESVNPTSLRNTVTVANRGSAFWIAGTGTYSYIGTYNDGVQGANGNGTYPTGQPVPAGTVTGNTPDNLKNA